MKLIIVLLFLLFLVFGCNQKIEIQPPEKLIDETRYLNIYIELHLFNSLVGAVDTLENEDSLKTELFNKYSVSEVSFRESHSYYQSQTQLHKIRIDTAIARLERTLKALNQNKEVEETIRPNDNTPAYLLQN